MYMCNTIQHTFETSNMEMLVKLYNIMVVPVLLYGCENWTITKTRMKEEPRLRTRNF